MRGKKAEKSADQAYYEATPRSRAYHKRSLLAHVNGVHHNIRFYEPYPFVARSASKARIRDIDGNSYADYWMGHWSMILGHAHPAVRKRLQAQLGLGWMHGTSSQNTLELSAIIRRAVRAAERIRYVTSGTEAAMYAVRLARAYTGRKIIAKVDGGWHGYTSDLLKTVNWPYNTKESRGLVSDRHVISVPYNDLGGTISALKKAGKDLAGIMMEPVLGGGGCIPAERSYMKGVQEYARKKGALFMLDEIVTGFRFGYGCLHTEMRLDPDIVLLGKIIGGGMPIGAICGKSEIMEISNTSKNAKTARAYIGGGTFSANPAAMAAGAATLDVLRAEKSSLYPRIARLGKMARDGIAQALGPSCTVTGKGSLFMPHFGAGPIKNAADAARCDSKALGRHHFELIAKHKIFFLPGKLGAVSAAHTKEDIARMIAATESLSEGGQA